MTLKERIKIRLRFEAEEYGWGARLRWRLRLFHLELKLWLLQGALTAAHILRDPLALTASLLSFAFFAFVIYGALFGMPHRSFGVPALWVLLLRYGWIAFVFGMLAMPLVNGSAQKHWYHFKKIRPLIVLQNLPILFAVVACTFYLSYAFPFLNGSWLHILPVGGDDGSAPNLMMVPLTLRLIGPLFFVLLLLNLPMLASAEEQVFRRGTRSWLHALGRSFCFGLYHCTMGVSVATGLALSIAGLWFSWNYFRGGEERSTLHHTTYNLIILGIVALVMLVVLR